MTLLLAGGSYAAVIVLLRRVGAGRQVQGRIVSLQYYPGVRALEGEIEVPQGWPGHRPGQFAFATSDRSEGAHPYTVASAWNDTGSPDHLHHQGAGRPYQPAAREAAGRAGGQDRGALWLFRFRQRPAPADLDRRRHRHHAVHRRLEASGAGTSGESGQPSPAVDLFHTTADYDETALAKLTTDGKPRTSACMSWSTLATVGSRASASARQCRDGARPPSGSAAQPVSARRCGRISPRMDYPWRSSSIRSSSR